MLRTREEWYKVAIERGTDGSMVFDILKDWKEEEEGGVGPAHPLSIAALVLTDEALKEAQYFVHISKKTSGLQPEFNPIHRLAIGALLSVEMQKRINIYSTKEIEGEKDV